MTEVINQSVKEGGLSEKDEDRNERGSTYTKICIEHLMTPGQGHIGVNIEKKRKMTMSVVMVSWK